MQGAAASDEDEVGEVEESQKVRREQVEAELIARFYDEGGEAAA